MMCNDYLHYFVQRANQDIMDYIASFVVRLVPMVIDVVVYVFRRVWQTNAIISLDV